MIFNIAKKELITYRRSGVFISLALAMIVIFAGAAALSSQRVATFESERAASEAVDREVWDAQGKRNPHAAAHFARYAFKPIPSLVVFDPGITDHAGIAVWMEAHYQNPAVFRRIEDLGDAGRMADLSLAWIMQFIAPLFIILILFGSISGERETGTLRQIAMTGIRLRTLLAGKLLGAGIALSILFIPAILITFWVLGGTTQKVLPDAELRSLGLITVYTIFIVAISVFAIGISALFSEKRHALIVLIGFWAVSFVMLPRLATGFANSAYSQLDAVHLSKELSRAATAARTDEEYQQEIKDAVLTKYAVESISELPINYSGYTLQMTEEYANPLFDDIYNQTNAVYARQEHIQNIVSIISPVLALQTLSAGLSGTDRLHHVFFTESAEQHRRKSVKLLNNDLMLNGAGQPRYTADESLWRQVEDFAHIPPRFSDIASHYRFSLIVLSMYFLAAFGFTWWTLARAQKRIAA